MCNIYCQKKYFIPDLSPHVGAMGNRPCSRVSVLYDATKLVILDRNVSENIQDIEFAICIVIM